MYERFLEKFCKILNTLLTNNEAFFQDPKHMSVNK